MTHQLRINKKKWIMEMLDQKSVLPHEYFFLLLQLINDVKLDKAGNISKLNSHIAKVNISLKICKERSDWITLPKLTNQNNSIIRTLK
jgi:hypothetical protein